MQLPAVATAIELPLTEVLEVSDGYIQPWHENPSDLRMKADAYVYAIVAIIDITAGIVMIIIFLYSHQTIIYYINSKTQPYYYYFWAAQFMVVVILLIVLPIYLSCRQNNIAIAPYVYLLTFCIDLVAALIIYVVIYCSKVMILACCQFPFHHAGLETIKRHREVPINLNGKMNAMPTKQIVLCQSVMVVLKMELLQTQTVRVKYFLILCPKKASIAELAHAAISIRGF